MRSRNLDARLAERGLREAWPVPPDRRPELVDRLIAIANNPDTPPREAVAASKALLMASRLNLETIRVSMAAREFEELEERLARLEQEGGTDEPARDPDQACAARTPPRPAWCGPRPRSLGLVRRGLSLRCGGRRVPRPPPRSACPAAPGRRLAHLVTTHGPRGRKEPLCRRVGAPPGGI